MLMFLKTSKPNYNSYRKNLYNYFKMKLINAINFIIFRLKYWNMKMKKLQILRTIQRELKTQKHFIKKDNYSNNSKLLILKQLIEFYNNIIDIQALLIIQKVI